MSEALIIVHLLVVLGLIGIVLLQRSEGGGLGMGQGGGFMTSRGKTNVLTRTTAILAGLFFATSMLLAILATPSTGPKSIFDAAPTINDNAPPKQGGILDQLPPSSVTTTPAQQQTAPLQPASPPPATPTAPISQ